MWKWIFKMLGIRDVWSLCPNCYGDLVVIPSVPMKKVCTKCNWKE